MLCASCTKTQSERLEEFKKKARQEAAKAGYSGQSVCIIELANGSGYGWRPIGHESLQRLDTVEYIFVD